MELQNSGEYDDIFIMIADAQALTDNADNPEKIRQNIIEVALDYLSCGIDPKKSHIFIQSQIQELCELSFYFMNLVTVARLQRNPTVKSEIKARDFQASIPVGFFTYPISQAADITLFKATTVPVGEDQLPMLEQAREIVRSFDNVYGEGILVEPKELLPDDYKNLQEVKDHYMRGGLGDVKIKKFLIKVLEDTLEPIRTRRKELEQDIPGVYQILKEGTEYARGVGAQTLSEVKSAMQINYFDDEELIAAQAEKFKNQQ